MNEVKRTLKHRALHGMKRGLVIVSYLFVVFSMLDVYKAVILAEHQIDLMSIGLNYINASALAKVILLGQELKLADEYRDAPLIYPTLLKSFVYTVLLACFKIVETAVVGLFRGRSISQSLAGLGGESWDGLLSLTLVLFVVLIPFFAFGELRRVFGEQVADVFLRPRHSLDLPRL